jgi:branched-chain amino acid transport system permease protein
MSAALRRWGAPLGVLVAGVLLILYFGGTPGQRVLTLVLIWAALGLSWNVIGGYAGQVSFGHAAFFGIGAYTSTLLAVHAGIPPAIGIWAGMALAVVAALLIGWPTFRLAGIYFSLATLAYPLIFRPILDYLGYQEVSLPFARSDPWLWLQFADTRLLSFVALVLVVAAVAISRAIERAPLGQALLAVRDDQAAAEAAGVDAFRVKMIAYAISAAIAAAAGTLFASVLLVVTPDAVFGLIVSVQALIIPIVGGIATVWGPLIGSAILITLSDWLTANYGADLPGINGVVFGCALVAIILFAPEGLYWRVSDLVRRRRAGPAREPASVAPAAPAPAGAHGGAGAGTAGRAPVEPAAREVGEVLLDVDGIGKSFGGLRALEDVTFTVRRGEILGIIGPNGAGKTTLFDILNGFTRADEGHVRLGGTEVTGLKPNRLCRVHRVGRTFQTVRPFRRMSLVENVEVPAFATAGNRRAARERAERALVQVGLADRPHAPVTDLNTSELRAMELARALAGDPQLLLVDEFLAGLGGEDMTRLVEVLTRVRDSGVTIVVIEHTMGAMVGLVDRFVVLDHGRAIAEGRPEEVVRDPVVVEAYLGKRWVEHAQG